MNEKKKKLVDKTKEVSELLDGANKSIQTESLTLLRQLAYTDWKDLWEELYEETKINREAREVYRDEL